MEIDGEKVLAGLKMSYFVGVLIGIIISSVAAFGVLAIRNMMQYAIKATLIQREATAKLLEVKYKGAGKLYHTIQQAKNGMR